MKKWFTRQHVYTQLAVLASATALIFAAFFITLFQRVESNIQSQRNSYIEDLSAQLQQTVEDNYHSYAEIIRLISYNKDVQSFLGSSKAVEKYSLYTALKRNLTDFASLSPQIQDIILIDTAGERYNMSDQVYPLPFLELSANLLKTSDLQTVTPVGGAGYLVMAKRIYSIDSYVQTNQWIGTLYLVLSSAAFTGSDTYPDYGSGTVLFLTDSADALVWTSAAEDAYTLYNTVLEKGEALPYYARREFANIPGYHIVACQMQQANLLSAIDWQTGFVLAVACLFFLIVLGWMYWARGIVRPIRKLAHFMEHVRDSDLNALNDRVYITGYEEVESLGAEFNSMLSEVHDLTERLITTNANLYESELLAKQAELTNLRSQINPHFLYNTLETMVGIAYTEGQPELADIARSLGVIFKYSIKGSEVVPLKAEIKIAESYTFIQQYRFSERLCAEYRIDTDCLECLVPKMIVQPLIENAVVHGVEPQQRKCHITVSAHLHGKELHISVEDDGGGIEPARLAVLQESLHPGPLTRSGTHTAHVGLANVDSRIKLIYGPQYGLHLESTLGKGTKTTIVLPLREKEEPACIR